MDILLFHFPALPLQYLRIKLAREKSVLNAVKNKLFAGTIAAVTRKED